MPELIIHRTPSAYLKIKIVQTLVNAPPHPNCSKSTRTIKANSFRMSHEMLAPTRPTSILTFSGPSTGVKFLMSNVSIDQIETPTPSPGKPGSFDTLMCLREREFDNVAQNRGGKFSTVWDGWV